MKRLFLLVQLTLLSFAAAMAEDVELTSVNDLTTGYFIMAHHDGTTYLSPYWLKSNNQNVMTPAESAVICNGADYYYLLKAEEITYKNELVYRISISNGLHELFPRGIGGAAYMNSAGWCFFAGESAPSGKSHVYGQDADGLGLWRITYTEGKGFQFQCVGNDKYVSYTMGNSSSADKYYWQCFAEGSLYDAAALTETPTYAEFVKLHDILLEWVGNKADITCDEAARTALSDALSKTEKDVDAAMTVEAIQGAIDELRAAGVTFLTSVQLAEGSDLDVTILLVNPSFETGTTDGWTVGKPSQGGDVGVKKSENEYETAGTDGFYLFNTWSVSDSYVYGSPEQYVQQTLSQMPPGEYRLTALASSNTYQSANAPVEFFGNNYTSSFVPQSRSTFKETYEVGIFLMPSDQELTVGMRSAGWFRADNFRLTYYGRSEAYEQTRRMEGVNLYENIASQALDRSAYDAVLTQVRQALQVPDITDEQIAEQNALLRQALMELVSTGTTPSGQFDLTMLLDHADVVRASNLSALTNLLQTLPDMPPGHYTFRANAFFRPTEIADALELNEGGTEDHPASIYLGKNQTAVVNIFDDARHALSNSMDILATIDGRAAPMTDAVAMDAFALGDYGAVVEYDLAAKGDLAVGFRIKAPRKTGNLFLAANRRLLYGATPKVNISKHIPAGQLTPLCVPFELQSDDSRQLYAIAGITGSEATIFPVTTIHPCEPCVISTTEAIDGFSLPDTEVSGKQADTAPLPWDGGTLTGDLTSFTWTATSVDGKKQTKAEDLTFTVADPLNLEFTVNLENLQVRRFLEKEDYFNNSGTRIEQYNIAPPARRDQPNNVAIPVTQQATGRYKLILSQNADLSQPTTLSNRLTDGRLFYVPNLIPQRTYYYEVQNGNVTVGKGKFHTDGHLRMIYAPSIDNIRDMGGWQTTDGQYIRYGRIYRGGELNGSHEATANAVKRLKSLGITAEIDLRADYEQSGGKSAFGFTTTAGTYYFANAMDCYPENLEQEECYVRWKDEFDLIMKNLRKGGNIYFHCRIGADRTGLLSLFLEGLLGVPKALSNKNYELTTFSPSGVRLRSTQNEFFPYLDALSGDTWQQKITTFFTQKLGVSQEDIDEFRSIMLTPDCADAIRDIPAVSADDAESAPLTSNGPIYDLSGRRVAASPLDSRLPHGLYIRGGKKILYSK